MQVKIYLDEDMLAKIRPRALAERRPLPWQVEVELRRALGLPFPPEPPDHRAGRSQATASREPLKPLPLR